MKKKEKKKAKVGSTHENYLGNDNANYKNMVATRNVEHLREVWGREISQKTRNNRDYFPR